MPKEKCFFICPIGDENSQVRRMSDEILKEIIYPKLGEKYEIIRADMINSLGDITADIFDHLINDELAIADLSGHNPNVFYELAIRHAYNKPVILIIREGENIPFDVALSRVIHYSNVGFGKTEVFRNLLASTVEYYEQNGTPDSPVTSAERIKKLDTGNSFEQSLAAIEKKIDNVLGEVSKMNNRLERVESRFLPVYNLNDVMTISPSAISFGNTAEGKKGHLNPQIALGGLSTKPVSFNLNKSMTEEPIDDSDQEQN